MEATEKKNTKKLALDDIIYVDIITSILFANHGPSHFIEA